MGGQQLHRCLARCLGLAGRSRVRKLPCRYSGVLGPLTLQNARGLTDTSLSQIQGLAILNHPEYAHQRWHGTLIQILLLIRKFDGYNTHR